MRASIRLAWRVAAVVAFGATAALAVTLTRGAPAPAALTSARHMARGHSATPWCAPSRLRISLGAAPGTGVPVLTGAASRLAAGAVTRYRLEFTNVSGAACTLSGYPEVAAYRDDGAQVGNAAGRDTSVAARRILLAPGATVHTAVIASVSAGPCRPVVVAGLRVVPPGQPAARYIRHALRACSAAGPGAPVFLRVRAVQPDAGTARPRRPVS
jgi:hypothetical protein